MNMFQTMKAVVLGKSAPVAQLHKRIDVFFAQGRLTEEEKAELEQMVFDNQSVDAEKAGLEERYAALIGRITALEERVAALEGGEDVGAGDEIPAWRPWDGVSQDYQPGAVVTHGGKTWRSAYAGQNVWEPGGIGIDERYWEAV